MSSPSFSVGIASPADLKRIVDFLAVNYFPYEPLNLAITKAAGKFDYPNDDDFAYVVGYLPQCRTLLAVDGDDLIGLAVLREVTSEDCVARAEIIAKVTAEDDKIFYNFYSHIDKMSGFWDEGGPQKALDLHILVVGVGARGRGLGKTLIEASRNVAREDGYELFRIDCSSCYSSRLAETLGMTCVYSLPYEEYKNENGEVVLHVTEPHKAFQVFMQKL